tara:strand:+ start:354 stop:560 length:207 start_codon:yes stop_codon:yes gene_type:complete
MNDLLVEIGVTSKKDIANSPTREGHAKTNFLKTKDPFGDGEVNENTADVVTGGDKWPCSHRRIDALFV